MTHVCHIACRMRKYYVFHEDCGCKQHMLRLCEIDMNYHHARFRPAHRGAAADVRRANDRRPQWLSGARCRGLASHCVTLGVTHSHTLLRDSHTASAHHATPAHAPPYA